MRYPLILLVSLSLLFLSACNLSANNGEPETESTLVPTATPAGKPQVSITSPQDGAEFVVNDPLFVEATVSDPIGVTEVQLMANSEIVRKIAVEAENSRSAEQVIQYTPRTTGDVTLSVVAFRGSTSSDPASVNVYVRDSRLNVTATSPPGDNAPVIDPNNPNCRALVNTNLNFRDGPGTNFDIIRVLGAGEVLRAVGRLADNSWWQLVDRSGRIGWVSAPYVTMYDGTVTRCSSIQIVAPPATATSPPQPTATPLPTQTPIPTPIPTSTPVPEPNLYIARIAGPETVTIPSGETEVVATFSVNITNDGGALNEQFDVEARVVNGDTYDVGTFGNLDANQTLSQSVDITFDTVGEIMVIFEADSSDNIEESNESDNDDFIVVTVESE